MAATRRGPTGPRGPRSTAGSKNKSGGRARAARRRSRESTGSTGGVLLARRAEQIAAQTAELFHSHPSLQDLARTTFTARHCRTGRYETLGRLDENTQRSKGFMSIFFLKKNPKKNKQTQKQRQPSHTWAHVESWSKKKKV